MRAVIAAIRRAIDRYRAQPRLGRELILLVGMLLVAILVLPTLIWIGGQIFLGDYLRSPAPDSAGGPLALTIDLLAGIASGSLGHWLVLLGPYLLLTAFRGARALLKM